MSSGQFLPLLACFMHAICFDTAFWGCSLGSPILNCGGTGGPQGLPCIQGSSRGSWRSPGGKRIYFPLPGESPSCLDEASWICAKKSSKSDVMWARLGQGLGYGRGLLHLFYPLLVLTHPPSPQKIHPYHKNTLPLCSSTPTLPNTTFPVPVGDASGCSIGRSMEIHWAGWLCSLTNSCKHALRHVCDTRSQHRDGCASSRPS